MKAHDYADMEAHGYRVCSELAGADQARRIAAVDLSEYQAALATGCAAAIALALESKAKAIYFEYNMDSDWTGSFFICAEYLPESSGDDDWASDWTNEITGPPQSELSQIYLENGWRKSPASVGSTTFLVARTMAAFGRAGQPYMDSGIAICIAYHDQDPIVRAYEPTV